MTEIVCSVDVDRPVAEVFAYVIDPARFPEWQDMVESGHYEGDGIGRRCITTRRMGPMRRTFTQVVTEEDPPRSWVARATDGPIRVDVNVTVEALDDGRRSRVRIVLDFRGHGFGKALLPMILGQARKETDRNGAELKARLEGST